MYRVSSSGARDLDFYDGLFCRASEGGRVSFEHVSVYMGTPCRSPILQFGTRIRKDPRRDANLENYPHLYWPETSVSLTGEWV